ncbi:SigB/SigF/SigG family RNA polymerase sigma factor [soil metagenome]
MSTVVTDPPVPIPAVAATRDERELRTHELLVAASRTQDPTGCRRLQDQVIELNVAVAASVAHRFQGRGLEADDLEQVAYLGLVKAVRRFDASHGVSFLSFAVPTIRGEIKRHFRDHVWAVRPPRRLQELRADIPGAQEKLSARLRRSPTPRELAQHLDADVDQVLEVLSSSMHFHAVSLDQPTEASTGSSMQTPLHELIGAHDGDYARTETVIDLRGAVASLPERDRQILDWRITQEWTQRQIADTLGLSQMQVSRLLRGILTRLREQLAA